MIYLTEFQILCSILNLSSGLMERSRNDLPDRVPDLVFHLEPLHFPLVGIIPEHLHYHLQLSVIHSTEDYKENCYILVTIKILQNTERDRGLPHTLIIYPYIFVYFKFKLYKFCSIKLSKFELSNIYTIWLQRYRDDKI